MVNSTFGILNAAATGLQAARAGMDVVGQNIANLNTEGYTRQRVTQSAMYPLKGSDILDSQFRVGAGVTIGGTQRLGDALLERRVQGALADGGQAGIATTVFAAIEASVGEPSDTGLAATLASFWSSWQDVAANPTNDSIRGTLIEQAKSVITRLSQAATAAENTWTNVRADVADAVTEVNELAVRFADLNGEIRKAGTSGGSINELLDEQNRLANELSQRIGSTLRRNGDGTAEVIVGGNALVSGTTARPLRVAGALDAEGVASGAVRVEWVHNPGVSAEIDNGEIGGRLAALASAADGGPLLTQLGALDDIATALASKVNALHQTGATRAGATGLDFFELASGVRPSQGLSLVSTDVDDIAAATPLTGGAGGQVADQIALLSTASDGPDAIWNRYVVALGTASRAASTRSVLAEQASAGAQSALQSQTGVDLDEETVALMTYQHAYQGAARVLTAVDEMLDTLINRTGLVGR